MFSSRALFLFTAVIMTPTRELALQITKECKKFSKPLGLRVVCVYGGTGISEQVNTSAPGPSYIYIYISKMWFIKENS